MAIVAQTYYKESGNWRTVPHLPYIYYKSGGNWIPIVEAYVKVSGTWYTCHRDVDTPHTPPIGG
jgi:hypothetical protein